MVRRAYIGLMKAHHGGAASPLTDELIRRVGLAYWELRHPDRRAVYDERLQSRRRSRPATQVTRDRGPAARRLARSGPRPGTRLLFGLSLLTLAAGIWWAMDHRPKMPRLIVGGPDLRQMQPQSLPTARMLEASALDQAFTDFNIMVTAGGLLPVNRYLNQCFAELRTGPWLRLFDYCVALESLAAREPAAKHYARFGKAARRARAIDALEANGDGDARWSQIERVISARTDRPPQGWQRPPVRPTGAAGDEQARR